MQGNQVTSSTKKLLVNMANRAVMTTDEAICASQARYLREKT